MSWQAWIIIAWLAGSLLFLSYVAVGFISLRRLERRCSHIIHGSWPILLRELCTQLGVRRRVDLLGSPDRAMPMTWGLWRTRLLLPDSSSTWAADQRRTVLLHELAHARRWDCATQLVVQIACALYWFNPLVWLAWRRMQTEREQACDDLVLASGTKASAYAEQLLHIASEMPATRFSAAAIAMARPSRLEGRLLAILDVRRNRRTLTWSAVALAMLLVGTVAVPLAMVRAASRQTLPDGGADSISSSAASTVLVEPSTRSSRSVPTQPPEGFGRIVDVQGNPIAGAKIRSTHPEWSTESGRDGLFRLPPPLRVAAPESNATASLTITATGCIKREDVGLWLNGYGEIGPNKGVIQLHRAGRLEGRVLGPDGKPMAGAPLSVTAWEQYPIEGRMTANAVQGITDRDGRFVITDVPPGDLLLYY